MNKVESKKLIKLYRERLNGEWPEGKLTLSNQYGMIFLLTEDGDIFMRLDKLLDAVEKDLLNK